MYTDILNKDVTSFNEIKQITFGIACESDAVEYFTKTIRCCIILIELQGRLMKEYEQRVE